VCGIIGSVSHSPVALDVLHALERLEYRGYDSAGVAYLNHDLSVTKRSGGIAYLRETLSGVDDRFQFGIAHTRWSTHGPPTDGSPRFAIGIADATHYVASDVLTSNTRGT
jgi:glucosamine--fructose-6-phosphate aminotransferase (isomerizing)